MASPAWILPVAGTLLLLSAIAHAILGWPPIRADLLEDGVAPGLVGGSAVGWYFAGVAFVVPGLILDVPLIWNAWRRG